MMYIGLDTTNAAKFTANLYCYWKGKEIALRGQCLSSMQIRTYNVICKHHTFVVSNIIALNGFLQSVGDVALLGVVEGGAIIDERKRSAKETVKRPLAGVGHKMSCCTCMYTSPMYVKLTITFNEIHKIWKFHPHNIYVYSSFILLYL